MQWRRTNKPDLSGLFPDACDDLLLAWATALETGAKTVDLPFRGPVSSKAVGDALVSYYASPFGRTISPLVAEVLGVKTPLMAPQGDMKVRPRVAMVAVHIDGALALIRDRYMTDGRSDLDLLARKPKDLPLAERTLREMRRSVRQMRSHFLPEDLAGSPVLDAEESTPLVLKPASVDLEPKREVARVLLGRQPDAAVLKKTPLQRAGLAARAFAFSLLAPAAIHSGVSAFVAPLPTVAPPGADGVVVEHLARLESEVRPYVASPLEPYFPQFAGRADEVIAQTMGTALDVTASTSGWAGTRLSLVVFGGEVLLAGAAMARRRLQGSRPGIGRTAADGLERDRSRRLDLGIERAAERSPGQREELTAQLTEQAARPVVPPAAPRTPNAGFQPPGLSIEP